MRKILIAASMLLSLGAAAQTGAYNEQAAAYIRQYKELAMEEQQRSGIPAAITLAQGIHETQAGTSELATEANNHFGIKCKKEWQGETYAHTDDAPNECFRKYTKAIDSYRDHSDYLRSSKRYQSCFELNVTDYASWAAELKRCGYATNPRYAQKLIRIVEDFHLQDYTYAAMEKKSQPKSDEGYVAAATPVREPAPVAKEPGEVVPDREEPVAPQVKDAVVVETPVVAVETPYEEPVPVYGQTVQRNGLKGFYAHKGDVLLEHAIKYNVRYARILELNDLPDAPLEADMFVYLEKKHASGVRRMHKVKEGETMIQVAQAEGIQLKTLRNLNQIDIDEEPVDGAMLHLQTGVAAKPAVRRKDNRTAANVYRQTRVVEENNTPAPIAHKEEIVEEAEKATPVRAVVTEEKTVPVPPQQRTYTALKAEPEPIAMVKQNAPVEVTADDEAKEAAPVVIQETPAEKTVEQPVEKPVEIPVEKPVVKRQSVPRPQPRPTAPKQKTFTIADEMAVGEEQQDNQKFSPRYVAPKSTPVSNEPAPYSPPPPSAYTAKPLTEEPPVTRVAAIKQEVQPVVKQEPVVREEDLPQDEFSKLKRQLDKAVYGTKKTSSANMTVVEERPAPGREVAPVAATANTPVVAANIAPAGNTYHVVKNGETAFSIAKQYGISMKDLREMNNLNFEAIKVGQKLKVK